MRNCVCVFCYLICFSNNCHITIQSLQPEYTQLFSVLPLLHPLTHPLPTHIHPHTHTHMLTHKKKIKSNQIGHSQLWILILSFNIFKFLFQKMVISKQLSCVIFLLTCKNKICLIVIAICVCEGGCKRGCVWGWWCVCVWGCVCWCLCVRVCVGVCEGVCVWGWVRVRVCVCVCVRVCVSWPIYCVIFTTFKNSSNKAATLMN